MLDMVKMDMNIKHCQNMREKKVPKKMLKHCMENINLEKTMHEIFTK